MGTSTIRGFFGHAKTSNAKNRKMVSAKLRRVKTESGLSKIKFQVKSNNLVTSTLSILAI